MDILVLLTAVLSVLGIGLPALVFGLMAVWALLGIPVAIIALIVKSCRS